MDKYSSPKRVLSHCYSLKKSAMWYGTLLNKYSTNDLVPIHHTNDRFMVDRLSPPLGKFFFLGAGMGAKSLA